MIQMAFTQSVWPPSKMSETPIFLLDLFIDPLLVFAVFFSLEIHLMNIGLPIYKHLTDFHLKEHPSLPCSEVCWFDFL